MPFRSRHVSWCVLDHGLRQPVDLFVRESQVEGKRDRGYVPGRLDEELEAQVREARREIDEIIRDLKAKTNAIAEQAARHAVSTGATRNEIWLTVDFWADRVLTSTI
jgi:hypothetical protein